MELIYQLYRGVNYLMRRIRKVLFNSITHNRSNISIIGHITIINRDIMVGNNVTIYPNCMFYGDGKIEIHDNVSIGNGTIIYSSKNNGGVSIGANTMIAAQCYIIDTDHGTSNNELIRNQKNTASPIFIGEDCWLGANVTVLKGSKILDGSIIGAKALVKGTTEPFSISVGVPCSLLRYRE